MQGFDWHVSSQLLQDWTKGSKRDDWKGFLSAAREDGATQDELQKIKRMPNLYRVLANAKCVGRGLPPQFPTMLGQKPAAAKHEYVAEALEHDCNPRRPAPKHCLDPSCQTVIGAGFFIAGGVELPIRQRRWRRPRLITGGA